jgi:hypothetical protein
VASGLRPRTQISRAGAPGVWFPIRSVVAQKPFVALARAFDGRSGLQATDEVSDRCHDSGDSSPKIEKPFHAAPLDNLQERADHPPLDDLQETSWHWKRRTSFRELSTCSS